jgi:transcriptional regulator with XRE-family HTH domain
MNVMAITVTDDARREFGERLKSWREERGITQQELSFQLGCAISAISKWERGIKYPRMLYVRRTIKELTGLDVDEIALKYQNSH